MLLEISGGKILLRESCKEREREREDERERESDCVLEYCCWTAATSSSFKTPPLFCFVFVFVNVMTGEVENIDN